jgi:hypothetical protein
MATKGTAWVLRRCTDLLPYLMVMAVRELCHGPHPEPPTPAALAVPARNPGGAGHELGTGEACGGMATGLDS